MFKSSINHWLLFYLIKILCFWVFLVGLSFFLENIDFYLVFSSAYDILSDEEKRKNYDMYGDEKGSPGFDAGHPGDNGGYTYFTSGGPGPGHDQFNFKPDEWQSMGGQGGSKSFSFSFGGSRGQDSFGFGMDDIFSNFFGGGNTKGGGSRFGGFGGSTRSQSSPRSSPKSIRNINSQVFEKEIADRGMTWLLLSYTPTLKGNQHIESILEEVASSLQGALKVLIYFYLLSMMCALSFEFPLIITHA
jgi:curved DNA-binding protein CbpA